MPACAGLPAAAVAVCFSHVHSAQGSGPAAAAVCFSHVHSAGGGDLQRRSEAHIHPCAALCGGSTAHGA
eukprot:1148058-Pelagomonas_calceolata.AAC.3